MLTTLKILPNKMWTFLWWHLNIPIEMNMCENTFCREDEESMENRSKLRVASVDSQGSPTWSVYLIFLFCWSSSVYALPHKPQCRPGRRPQPLSVQACENVCEHRAISLSWWEGWLAHACFLNYRQFGDNLVHMSFLAYSDWNRDKCSYHCSIWKLAKFQTGPQCLWQLQRHN